ncbi:hypothetical protein NEDG_00817 [Nematocida displodere]|uniref:Uncharacterized protein n=1 Tax=Nematocida displodere TaxID=1805483 RepID=A0A177ECK7_9MICR|nr:hypothetical protein NEDG_00817 [Nematocida displodere]
MKNCTLPGDIFSVETLSYLVVMLIDGRVCKVENENVAELFNLEDNIKHTHRHENTIYIATSSTLFSLVGEELKPLHKLDLSQISAMATSKCGSNLCIGHHDGKITVITPNETYTYQEHEDSIIGLVIRSNRIYSASEDGIINKTVLLQKEAKDTYAINKVIKYIGDHFGQIMIIDLGGSIYTLNTAINDLTRTKKVVKKVYNVFLLGGTIYTTYRNELFQILSLSEAAKMEVPELRIDGLFKYQGTIYPFVRNMLRNWAEETVPNELEEFFEDL